MALTDRELAELAREAALEAGAAIMAVYATDFEVQSKVDRSPVTEADEAGERLIIAALRAAAPQLPIVAEESAAAGNVPEVDGNDFWLVDPLDGTREFINRRGDFTVNVALIRGRVPVLGCLHVPAKATTYTAYGPGEVRMERDGGPALPVRARPCPADGAVVVASRSHLSPETEEWLKGVKVRSFAQAGSSLKFALIAAGEADLYPRHGRTMEWDTAAGHAVLACAGGSVTTLDGTPLTYGKPGFENPWFIARGLPSC